ncbi:MAG TPA: sialate O-acetylesterase [Planctomycetota bacterium]|nr:sialate O-acetylesterase [Planctomycetota bacterium]
MEITAGLWAHGVLQRTAKNVSDTTVQGTCAATGTVFVRAVKGTKKIRGLDGVAVGKAAQGGFTARLQGLPAGGPYTVDLWIAGGAGSDAKPVEKIRVNDVLVGDLWMLGGQSNMQGIGWLEYALPTAPLVRNFYMHDQWGVAKDPLHNLWDAVDSVHSSRGNGKPQKSKFQGVGPGLSFGQAMQKRTGVPQGLIACAHGGTSMSEWDPAKLGMGGGSLYGASIRRAQKNGGRVAGILWYQGESDANPAAVGLYTQRMETLIAAFRRDLNDAALPFVAVQIGKFISQGPASNWNSIQEQQRRLPVRVPHMQVVPAIDLGLDDLIHVGGREMVVLGRRLCEAMDVLKRGKKAASGSLAPIELAGVTVRPCKVLGSAEIVVRFKNVKGRLQSTGDPSGFSLAGGGGGGVIRTTLQGNSAVIRTTIPMSDTGSFHLHYGQGFAPVCNMTDLGGRSLPVFGPVALGRPRAVTPCVNCLQVSPLLPGGGRLDGLNYPADVNDLLLKLRQFEGAFCDIHLEVGARGPVDLLSYFRFGFRCATPMPLALWLGYDGPVKVWIDGTEKFHDPEGTNPARLDDAKLEFTAAAGKHEVLVALSTNKGNAWGVYLQLERTDITDAQLDAGLTPADLPILEP